MGQFWMEITALSGSDFDGIQHGDNLTELKLCGIGENNDRRWWSISFRDFAFVIHGETFLK